MTTATQNRINSPMDSCRSAEEDLLEVTDLRVCLPTGRRTEVEAVKSVSLHLKHGERVGIVGESGSGKSVTGRAVGGLLPASARVKVQGSVRINGKEMIGSGRPEWDKVRQKTVGMIFQDPLTYLNPTMTIGAQVAESISPARKKAAEKHKDEVLHFLSQVGLKNVAELARQYPHELSGGMRQRVLIAIAIAKQPDLLIADEPTTALDATVQRHVLNTLDQTVADLGTSLILISHDLAVVAGMTDRVYVMYAGRIVESGPTDQVLNRPTHPYTQALIRSVRSLTDDGVELYSIPLSLRKQLIDDLVQESKSDAS